MASLAVNIRCPRYALRARSSAIGWHRPGVTGICRWRAAPGKEGHQEIQPGGLKTRDLETTERTLGHTDQPSNWEEGYSSCGCVAGPSPCSSANRRLTLPSRDPTALADRAI